jgi:hypothetical protein
LTADIFALFIGIYLFGEIFDWLYLVSFFVILAALIGFHMESWRYEAYIRVKEESKRQDQHPICDNAELSIL